MQWLFWPVEIFSAVALPLQHFAVPLLCSCPLLYPKKLQPLHFQNFPLPYLFLSPAASCVPGILPYKAQQRISKHIVSISVHPSLPKITVAHGEAVAVIQKITFLGTASSCAHTLHKLSCQQIVTWMNARGSHSVFLFAFSCQGSALGTNPFIPTEASAPFLHRTQLPHSLLPLC